MPIAWFGSSSATAPATSPPSIITSTPPSPPARRNLSGAPGLAIAGAAPAGSGWGDAHPAWGDPPAGGLGQGPRRLRLVNLLRGPGGAPAAGARVGARRHRQSRRDGPGLLRV